MIKPILLFIMAAIILNACHHSQSSKKASLKDSTLTLEKDQIAEKMEGARPDTSKKAAINQDEEGQINLKKPILISDEWIKKARTYKWKKMPDQLIKTIVPDYETGGFVNYSDDVFFIEDENLDNDSNKEIIIGMLSCEEDSDHTPALGTCGFMGIIKKNGNNWYLIAKVQSGMHYNYPVSLEIDKGELIRWTGESWGFSAGITVDFYKLIDGKLIKVFGYYEDMHWGGMGDNTLGAEIHGSDSFSPDQKLLSIHYTFDAFKEQFPDNYDFDNPEEEVPQVFILKGQDNTVHYKWDNISHIYQPTADNPFKSRDVSDYLDYGEFLNLYKKKIKYISQHGTKKQRKAVKHFNEKE